MSQMPPIQMVDLKNQFKHIRAEVEAGIQEVLENTAFINGPRVRQFQADLEAYLNAKHVVPCANGTDALQIALMALGLRPGDEVIVPAFTYVATAEVIALLGLTPVMVDVCPDTFNITPEIAAKAIGPRTKAIVPVHLFGQSADMEGLLALAEAHHIYIVEDNAQAIGADYTFKSGEKKKTGAMGHIGCTSFYPSKNLGCYGDGGALMTNDDTLAAEIRMVANHGQSRTYYHDVVGVNSRLDSLQAVVLQAKLKRLDEYNTARQKAADYYDAALKGIAQVQTPVRQHNSTHVFHQYTLRVKDGRRDALQNYLKENAIPSMVYYPVPLYEQRAFAQFASEGFSLPTTEVLCREVISLPMHTELEEAQLDFICSKLTAFFG